MSGGEPIPMATSAAATPHGTNALARAANRVISYLNIQRVPHREVGSHAPREDTPHTYIYSAYLTGRAVHTPQGPYCEIRLSYAVCTLQRGVSIHTPSSL